ncbi:hypothetical protein K501DRAFT_304370 [Backusella circina FSU 941]|nr:hypothetical protein K501DRAFT_304370 [Backusella circina FSU 941]
MLISTVAFVFFTAISLLTTVYVIDVYDIHDYYFLKDIFVPGTRNLVIIEPVLPTSPFDNFDEAINVFDVIPPAEEGNFATNFATNFEQKVKALSINLNHVRESIAHFQESPMWFLLLLFAFVLWMAFWFSLPPYPRPPPRPPRPRRPLPNGHFMGQEVIELLFDADLAGLDFDFPDEGYCSRKPMKHFMFTEAIEDALPELSAPRWGILSGRKG